MNSWVTFQPRSASCWIPFDTLSAFPVFFLEAVWKTDGASEKKYCRTGQAHICVNHANVSPSVTVVGLSGWEISVHYRLHYRHAVVGCEGIETLTMVRLLIFNLYAANDLSTRHGCFVTRTYTNELGALHTDRIMSSEAAALSRRPICGDILAGNVEVGHCYNPDTGIYWYLQCLYSKFQQCCIQYKFAVSRHNIKFFMQTSNVDPKDAEKRFTFVF